VCEPSASTVLYSSDEWCFVVGMVPSSVTGLSPMASAAARRACHVVQVDRRSGQLGNKDNLGSIGDTVVAHGTVTVSCMGVTVIV
jgi:hypothetical protein